VTSGITPIVDVQFSLCEVDEIVVLEMPYLEPASERLFSAG
jgi:hypothetical protein